MTPRRARLAAATVAGVAALAAVWTVTDLLPYRSLNHDEGVYLQQAELLLEGQLRMRPPVEDALRPWFFVDGPEGLYAKYSVPTAALWALGRLVTGSYAAALPVVAAATAAGAYATVATAFDRRTGVVAAALVAGSPLVLVQSGTFLSYLPTTALNLGFAACYLRGLRDGDRRLAAAAGLLTGLAFFARPYTAVLFATPFIVHALLTLAGARLDRELVVHHGLTAVLGLSGVAIALAYNALVTGDALVFPYQAFAPLDGPGFGTRRLLAYERTFTPELGWTATETALERFGTFWLAGGRATVILALVGVAAMGRELVRRPPTALPAGYTDRAARWVLAAVAVPVVAGNVAFWGTLNAMGDPEAPGGLFLHLGPFYHVDLVVPAAALGAWGAVRLVAAARRGLRDRTTLAPERRRPLVALLVVAVALALVLPTAGAAAEVVDRNRDVTETYEAAYEPFTERSYDDAVVYLPRTYGPWLNHPYQHLRNDADFDDGPVFALRGPETFAVAEAFPDRQLHRFVLRGPWAPPTDATVETAVRPVEMATGRRAVVDATLGVPAAYESVSLRMEAEGETATYSVHAEDGRVAVSLIATPDGVWLTGPTLERVAGEAVLPPDRDVELLAYLDIGTGAGITYRLEVPTTGAGAPVSVLTPYREVCTATYRCGGGAAAIGAATGEGIFLRTDVRATGDGTAAAENETASVTHPAGWTGTAPPVAQRSSRSSTPTARIDQAISAPPVSGSRVVSPRRAP